MTLYNSRQPYGPAVNTRSRENPSALVTQTNPALPWQHVEVLPERSTSDSLSERERSQHWREAPVDERRALVLTRMS